MANSKAFEMAGNMFVYENPRCDCKITTNYTDNGDVVHALHIKTIEGVHKYAYAPIDGLVMIDNKTGSIMQKHKAIEDFLNIKLQDINSIKEFIDAYGFVMPLPDDGKYKNYNHIEIGHIILRFRSMVQLMSAIENELIDYDKVLQLTSYLLFSFPRKIALNEKDEGICTCIHAFTKLWYNINELPSLDDNMTGDFSYDPYEAYYSIPDSFTEKEEHLSALEYLEKEDADPLTHNSSSIFLAKILKLYKDGFPENWGPNERYVIDFFYHLLKTGIEIDDISENGRITTSKNINTDPNFTEQFKSRLIDIAKLVIKEEFDFELYGIHPTYDIETMSPNWEIPNLFTALYLALFYTRPDYEVYRRCANPNCNRLFKVKTTNSRKQYHDTSCQNAAAQMRHRKNKK